MAGIDISGYGTVVTLQATKTFPVGVPLTHWADDADPIDMPVLQIADAAMGVNGDMLKWSKANPIKLAISVAPNSVDDVLLGILLQANRVGQGKLSARDSIQLTIVYPNFSVITFSDGIILDGMPGNSIASSGRLKTKTYNFAFAGYVEVGV